MTISPIRDTKGRTVGTSTIARDITERKRTEAALQRYANRLENLRAIERAILASHSPREIAGAALGNLVRLVPSWTGSVAVYDFDRQEIEVLASEGPLREWQPPGPAFATT